MADMAPLFRERLDTLQGAKAKLESELELLSKADAIDQPSLQRLTSTSSDLLAQAGGLLDRMVGRDTDADMVAQAEGLVEYFEDTAWRLERLASLGQKRS
jgi:hypothetical protein